MPYEYNRRKCYNPFALLEKMWCDPVMIFLRLFFMDVCVLTTASSPSFSSGVSSSLLISWVVRLGKGFRKHLNWIYWRKLSSNGMRRDGLMWISTEGVTLCDIAIKWRQFSWCFDTCCCGKIFPDVWMQKWIYFKVIFFFVWFELR